MYLIHSPLIKNINKEQKVLYLGDWCIKDKDLISNKNTYEIIPHPFSTVKKKNDAIKYCKFFYDFCLPILSKALNDVHGVKENTKYWKIIFGSWLIRYIEIFYERYSCISNAFELQPAINTSVLSNDSFQIPKDTMDFISKGKDHHYNLQLYSVIINELNIPVDDCFSLDVESRNNKENFKSYLKKFTYNKFHSFTNKIGSISAKNRIWVSDFGIYGKELIKFVALSQFFFWPMYFNNHRNKLAVNNNDVRSKISKLNISESNDDFTRIFFQSLSSNMPMIFLEGYKKLKEKIIRQYPKAPKAIISTNQWFFNDSFKILAAEMQKKGTKLFIVQHGGVEGIGRYESEENHLVEICDKYFMWGKNATFNTKIESIGSPKLSSYINYNYNNKNKYILYLSASFPRYTYVLHSSPLAGIRNNYEQWQNDFFNSLNKNFRKLTLYRKCIYAVTRFHDHQNQLIKFPELIQDTRQSSFKKILSDSRIVIIDNRLTTYIQCLVLNQPVILFWNQDDWEVRAEVEPYFNNLIDAGILFRSPIEAAKKLESVYENPEKWWQSEQVQSARNNFVTRFANTSKLWKHEWIDVGEKVKQNLFD